MSHLTSGDLFSLEEYAKIRGDFRAKVMAHKQNRKVHVGANATLYFEDRLTIQYQIQEMLRIERIFEQEGIADELAAYNPLIPEGSNWKATFMVEYPDVEERRAALAKLIGIEDEVWVQVEGHDKVYAIADEDLDREDESKTSSVHFLRFELTPGMVEGLKGGSDLVRALPALRAHSRDGGRSERRIRPGSRYRSSELPTGGGGGLCIARLAGAGSRLIRIHVIPGHGGR